MGRIISIELDLDDFSPDSQEQVVGLYNQGNLNRFLTLLMQSYIVNYNKKGKAETKKQATVKLDDTSQLLKVLLDIKESVEVLKENQHDTQYASIDEIKSLVSTLQLAPSIPAQTTKEPVTKEESPKEPQKPNVKINFSNKGKLGNLSALKKLKGGN